MRNASGPLKRMIALAPGPGAEERATMVSSGCGIIEVRRSVAAVKPVQAADSRWHRQQGPEQSQKDQVDLLIHFGHDNTVHVVIDARDFAHAHAVADDADVDAASGAVVAGTLAGKRYGVS